MKPLGQIKTVKGIPSKKDYHIHINNKKIENWWESICTYVSRNRLKQLFKKELNENI